MIREGKFENWEEVTPIVNKELYGENFDKYKGESAFRKPVKSARDYYEAGVFDSLIDDKYLKEVEIQKNELFKERKRMQDQRREYRKLSTTDSRVEHIWEEMLDEAKQLNVMKPLSYTSNVTNFSDREAVLFISDLHYGMVTDNIWNTYNIDICNQRLSELIAKTSQHLIENKVRKLHILILGDLAHGAIHTGCRVASEETTSRQLMQVAERIAEVIDALSGCVDCTDVYSTYGNHMRTIQNKNDSVHADNMEQIVPWWLEWRLADKPNINIIEAEWYEFIWLKVCGVSIVAVHGDLERFKAFGITMNTLFTKKFDETIDLAVMGDKHHLEEFEACGIESVIVRSLCGADDHSNDHRLYSAPGQTLMIFNSEDGRECTYNMKFKS